MSKDVADRELGDRIVAIAISKSTEAVVDDALLKGRARRPASIEEVAASLQTKPERVPAWEDGTATRAHRSFVA